MHTYAVNFVRGLKQWEREATVVALQGDLGSGKTTFVQGAAKALGVREKITSPTFVIEKIYPLTEQRFERLVHIDAYRLNNTRELFVLGWGETLRDPKNLIFIEWPERVAEAIPEGTIRFMLRFINEQTRGIKKNRA